MATSSSTSAEEDCDWGTKLKTIIGNRDIAKLSESEQLDIHIQMAAWPNPPDPTDEVQNSVRDFQADLAKHAEYDKIIRDTHAELIKCIGGMNHVLRELYLSGGKENIQKICDKARDFAGSRVREIFTRFEASLPGNKFEDDPAGADKFYDMAKALYGCTSRLGSYFGVVYFLTEMKMPSKDDLASMLGISNAREAPLTNIPSTQGQGYRRYTVNNNPCNYVPCHSLDSILSGLTTNCGETTMKSDGIDEIREQVCITLEDSLTSLLKMSFQLSELAVVFAAYGDYELPKTIHEFLIAMREGFLLLPLRNGAVRRMFDQLKYEVKEVGDLVYELGFRIRLYSKNPQETDADHLIKTCTTRLKELDITSI